MAASRKIQGITPKEKLFCYAYFNNNGNGAEAAIKAGYAPKSAKVTASKLLTKANVQNLLVKLQTKIEDKAIITKERIARELMKIGFFDIKKAYGENGKLKSISEMPARVTAAISGIKVDEECDNSSESTEKVSKILEVKFNNKIGALAELNRMFGYNAPTKIAATDPDGNPVKTVTQVEIVPPNKIDSD